LHSKHLGSNISVAVWCYSSPPYNLRRSVYRQPYLLV